MMPASRSAAVILCATLTLSAGLALSAPAAGQATWVPLIGGTAPGTPAEVTFLPEDSDAQQSWIEVKIHGFWREDVLGDDGVTYQRLSVPGLQSIGDVGAPELPAVRVPLAVPTDAEQISLGGVDVLSELSFEAIRVYPQPIPGEDEEFDPTEDPGEGDTVGTPETFTLDTGVYAGGPWPGAQAAEDPLTETHFGCFEGATCEFWPFSFDPATDQLTVLAHAKYYLAHGGDVLEPIPVSKSKDKLARVYFMNWAAVEHVGWQLQFLSAHSRYAIVMPVGFDAALHDFIQHKKLLGFDVTVLHQPIGTALGPMLAGVAAWYAEGDPGEDHYVLLVGDTSRIPLGTWTDGGGNEIPTDDLFASPVDGDFHKEVHVGRISFDSEQDLVDQLQKIIDYELSPVPGGRYDRALLVAHREGAPGKYEGAHEDVRTASYAKPPQFVTMYGSGLGPTDSQVSNWIDQGMGVVAYRGHGSTNAWTGWNAFLENYHKNEVIALSNTVHPVVWAVTCTNGNIGTNGGGFTDCIAETWMEAAGAGAVASYAATVTTSTTPNHELDRRLFQALYDEGLIVHGHALAWAEQHVQNAWPGHKNPWAYLLLGDPSMKIRRDAPEGISVSVVAAFASCGPGCVQEVAFDVQSQDEPLDGALVTLYKASLDPSQPDEVLTSRYTNAFGSVTLAAAPITPGPMHWSVQDDEGNVATGVIDVGMGSAWTVVGESLPGTHGPLSLVGVGTLQPGTYTTSILSNALEDSVATLVLGFSAIHAPFKGGIWVPAPQVVVPGIPTGPHGVINLPTTWPAGFPPGFSFYEQYWMADEAAVKGFASSNAIQGTTP